MSAQDIAEFSDPSEKTVLNVESLTAGYGESEVISDVNFHIDESEIVCLIGPNGAGKSTVMKSVYGFTTIHSGTITYNGEDITRLDPADALTAGMAYVLQESSIFPRMTVEENLMMGGFVLNDDDRVEDLVEDTFEEFDRLAERRNQKARTLSGGERRLLEIARGLILDPDLVFLDEPSVGLEPRYIDTVFNRITDLRDAGKTLMIVEQNAEKGLSIADRGYVLADGQLRYEGAGDRLLEDEQVGELYLGN